MYKAHRVVSEGGSPFTISGGCTWGTGKDGVCKVEAVAGATSTATTYSGTITPLFTVTVDDPTSSATASPTSTSNSAMLTSIGTQLYLGMSVASVLYLM